MVGKPRSTKFSALVSKAALPKMNWCIEFVHGRLLGNLPLSNSEKAVQSLPTYLGGYEVDAILTFRARFMKILFALL